METETSDAGTAAAVRDLAARAQRERLGRHLRAAQQGRREGLPQIVEELSAVLWRAARVQGLSVGDAEDVVQATWLALLDHLAEVRTPEALIGWLLTVVKRESWRINGVRNRERSTEHETLALLSEPAVPPEEEFLDGERQRQVWRALRRLPVRCQRLLSVVAYVHRPDYDAVAAALGMPRGSIGPTRGRCLAKLRAMLDEDPQWSVS